MLGPLSKFIGRVTRSRSKKYGIDVSERILNSGKRKASLDKKPSAKRMKVNSTKTLTTNHSEMKVPLAEHKKTQAMPKIDLIIDNVVIVSIILNLI